MKQVLQTDVLVVGGGLIGLAAAYDLARSGASVVCIDAGSFGSHQSGQNWGFARQQGRGLAELELMKRANEKWQRLSEELESDVAWIRGGNLAVFETPTQEQSYREWLSTGRRLGIDTRYVTPKEVSEIVPNWKRPIRGGIFAPEDGHAEPYAVVQAYVAACRKLGVSLLPHIPVQALTRTGSRITGAHTAEHVIYADTTVVAAGAWSRQLLGTVDIDLPQNYVLGTVSLTSALPPMIEATVWGPGFSFRQRKDGKFICTVGGGGLVKVNLDVLSQVPQFFGAFRKNWRRFTLRPSTRVPKEISALLRHKHVRTLGPPVPQIHKPQRPHALHQLKATLIGAENASVEDSWSGVIDSTPDGLPVIDGAPGPDGLVIATGFSGHGYGLAPAVGPVIDALVQNRDPVVDLQPFRFARFTQSAYKAPDAIL